MTRPRTMFDEVLPVRDIRLRVLPLEGRQLKRAYLTSDDTDLDFDNTDGYIQIHVPEVKLYSMVALDWAE